MNRSRRTLLAAASTSVLVAALAGWSTPASAAAVPCWNDVFTDLDGGGPDVVVGLPGYDVGGKVDAGAIAVFSNVAAHAEPDPKAPTKRSILTAADFGLATQSGARFGAAVATWQDAGPNDDADDCADLVVGAPGTTVAGAQGAGRVYLLGGSETGLGTVKKTFDESTLVGAGGPEAGDGFGSALAANTLSTLAIGVPGRDVHEIADAGRVIRLNWFGTDSDPEVVVIDQSVGEDENAEAGDRFGEVLDLLPTGEGDLLAVGIPHEDVGSLKDAGAIELFSPTSDSASMMTQNRAGAGGSAEAGDLYGSSLSHWYTFTNQPIAVFAIGVPGEDVGSLKDAGLVSFARVELGQTPEDGIGPLKGMAETQTQDTAGIPGASEAGDQYGASVLTGEFGQDNGREHLVVGAPYEDLASTKDAGQLSSTRFETDASPSTSIQPLQWTQDSAGVFGVGEAGDHFGARLSSVQLATSDDDTDLIWPVVLVTVPGEDVDGVTNVGMAYLGYAPGKGSVALTLPTNQPGAGVGMVPMQVFLGA